MTSRGYAVASFGLIAAYCAFPADLRWLPFLLASFAAIPAVAVGLRRSPVGTRQPWWLLLTAVGCLNAANLAWAWSTYLASTPVRYDVASAGLYALGYLFLLGDAVLIVLRRGRRDLGGVIDAAITLLALGGLLWDVVFLPFHQAANVPPTEQVFLFIDVFVMMGILGALLRVALVSRRIIAVWLLVAGLATCLVANVITVYAADPVTNALPDWTNVPFLLAYVCLGSAALHPTAVMISEPGPEPADDLTPGRLIFLGLMMALIPVVGGGRALLGLPVDGVLIAVGSAVLVPLVMLRVGRLSAQRRRAEQELLRLATVDTLTGLPNRAACLERLTTELATFPGRQAVLFCDLDGFKPVNDRLGHAAGDALLVAVAARLRGAVRENDLVSRFGGDEFVVVCHADDPRAAVDAVCERIREVVRQPIDVAGEQVRVGLSVGVAFAGPLATTDDLINRADLAMYEAKQSKALGRLSLAHA
ncbi:GGDEF domain-containing protein [Couchioplanes caeruleus]|uniref:GGDEF domain-containing protein n=1 Tax=Couchioplanes caeruleus TaxID=56438 RepID=UPI0014741367|nr:GGDEF domain-containing protein [Couchioplanes caeruleus]